MIRILSILSIGFGLGGGIGFFWAAAKGMTLEGHDHSAHEHIASHDHTELVDVPQADAPHVELNISPDPQFGWNLQLKVENFRFAPERAGGTHQIGEGHGHVYVNGEKIARLYGNWMHLDALPAGAKVEVTLNTNDHRQYGTGGQPIAAMAVVDEAR